MTRQHPFFPPRLSFFLHRGCAAALTVLFTALSRLPSSAHRRGPDGEYVNRRGQAAELRQDYDAAYEDYLHAHQKDPGDLRYRRGWTGCASSGGHACGSRRVLRQNGDLAGALNQFTRACRSIRQRGGGAGGADHTAPGPDPGRLQRTCGASDDSATQKRSPTSRLRWS